MSPLDLVLWMDGYTDVMGWPTRDAAAPEEDG